jgi:uncharacterized protein YndB with AHSA1/START domain
MPETKPQPKTRALHAEVEINAPVEAVWKALTDAEELARWFPLEAGANPNGTLWMCWRNEFKWESRIEIFAPPEHLRMIPVESLSGEQQDQETEKRDVTLSEPTVTDFHLEARGGRTVLRLVHSGFSADAEWDALYDGTKRGWKFQLWSLQHYLENHRGTLRHTAYVRTFLKKLPQAEAWQRLFGPEVLAREGKLENLKPGDRYLLRTAAGDRFEGIVQDLNPPVEFYGTVKNFNNSILAVHLDALFGYRDVNFYLFTYGVPKEQVEGIESRTRQLLQSLETLVLQRFSVRHRSIQSSRNAPHVQRLVQSLSRRQRAFYRNKRKLRGAG